MTRASRLGMIASFFTTLYLLAFFQILSVPLVDNKEVQEILPVVSVQLDLAYLHTLILQRRPLRYYCCPASIAFLACVDPMVASSVLWIILAMVAWVGYLHIQRLPRSLHRIAWSES